MKSKKVSEKYTGKELAESFVFRSKLTDKAYKKTVSDLAEARAKQRARSNNGVSLRFKILQLKYQMEECISRPYDENYTFSHFLKNYVEIINRKRYQFANEISIDETYLSQLINRHRAPSEEVIIRLELHSKSLINALTWFKLLEKEKENEIDTDKALREKEKKFVKGTVEIGKSYI